jgi:hypothetical protein
MPCRCFVRSRSASPRATWNCAYFDRLNDRTSLREQHPVIRAAHPKLLLNDHFAVSPILRPTKRRLAASECEVSSA